MPESGALDCFELNTSSLLVRLHLHRTKQTHMCILSSQWWPVTAACPRKRASAHHPQFPRSVEPGTGERTEPVGLKRGTIAASQGAQCGIRGQNRGLEFPIQWGNVVQTSRSSQCGTRDSRQTGRANGIRSLMQREQSSEPRGTYLQPSGPGRKTVNSKKPSWVPRLPSALALNTIRSLRQTPLSLPPIC